jgi:hypothetical protein
MDDLDARNLRVAEVAVVDIAVHEHIEPARTEVLALVERDARKDGEEGGSNERCMGFHEPMIPLPVLFGSFPRSGASRGAPRHG